MSLSPSVSPPEKATLTLGVVIASEYLGLAKFNVNYRITFTLSVDKNTPLGSSTLSASLMSLYGAVSGPTLSNWNVTVVVGDAVSVEIVSSS
jgi:Nis1 family